MQKPFYRYPVFFVSMVLLFVSCSEQEGANALTFYSTMYYYDLGWEQIMDLGDYSAAEVSYRKTMDFDPEFLVGMSVLARLTRDLEERLAMEARLEARKNEIQGDERLVLDTYISLVKYTNLRDQKSEQATAARQEAMLIGEENLNVVVHNYPEEVYLKSEYIEVLHAIHGPQLALDSLNSLMIPSQESNPFMLGYKAIMLAELEKYDEALVIAKQLALVMNDDQVAKPDAILADIYFKMKDYETAKVHADKANSIDPNNLDASRLKTKIDALVEESN